MQKDLQKMREEYPNHFSHRFELPVNRLPSKCLDRIPLKILFPGLLLGLGFATLGVYDLLYGADIPADETLLNISLFDLVLTLIGAGIIGSLAASYFRYRKIYFDGKNITVVYRAGRGKKFSYKEALKKYEGVRFRIEFFMFGFLNRNRYIVELYHKNPKKIIPLYISTNDRNVRQKWEYYARTLNLPAMVETDEGLVIREIDDLGKSVREMAEKWNIKEKFDPKAPVPGSLIVKNKDRKTIIKIRNRLWDAYSLMALFFLTAGAALAGAEFAATRSWETGGTGLNSVYAAGALLIAAALAMLFRREKLVIKKYKIVNVHKFMNYSRKKDEIAKTDIEAVDVAVNPATGRHYVAIISGAKTIIFGKKLPIEDLRWLKNFLLYEFSK